MEARKHKLLRGLEEAAAGAAPERASSDCKRICFQVLYWLPWELQYRAARGMCERYLPVFEAKWPGVTWPRRLLGDVDAWHRAEGRGTPDVPDNADSADTAYYFCFDFLLCAYHYKDDPVSLTANACGTMGHAAYARARNVWLADDPEAARIEQEKFAYYRIDEEQRPSKPASFHKLWEPEHNAYDNAAFIAVYQREWLHIAEWLRAEAVCKYPEPDDLEGMRRGLERWEAHQFLPIGPP